MSAHKPDPSADVRADASGGAGALPAPPPGVAVVAEPDPSASPAGRRVFLRLAAAATGAVALAAAGKAAASEDKAAKKEEPKGGGDDKKAPQRKKRRFGMAIDLDSCTACTACSLACAEENNIPMPGPEETARTLPLHWMDLISSVKGEYPDLKAEILPIPCLHCDDPPCVKVCPVGATYRSEEGIVAQIWDRCIGCRYCMVACPYSRRHFNWTEPYWPEHERARINPDVATRPAGIVEKCTFCHHRIQAVTEQARLDGEELTDKNYRRLTACATACPAEAITFGDLSDPLSEVSRLARSPRATRLLEELGTEPKVFYLRDTKWRD